MSRTYECFSRSTEDGSPDGVVDIGAKATGMLEVAARTVQIETCLLIGA
jgi:hypothetical protein